MGYSRAMVTKLHAPPTRFAGWLLLSAAIAVKWLVSYLQRHGMEGFGWYRIGVGLAVGGLILSGTFTI